MGTTPSPPAAGTEGPAPPGAAGNIYLYSGEGFNDSDQVLFQ